MVVLKESQPQSVFYLTEEEYEELSRRYGAESEIKKPKYTVEIIEEDQWLS